MAEKTNDQSIMDKSMRSVFVGNIPYEATEEKLKEIFSEVGPVLSLKLVFDRESGKPKGYGFCEYKDQETALSAMRNLNGYEIGGRTLRVDNACTEKSRMEMQQLLQGPQVENPYGEYCEPDQAPEIITKTVACLPPEQMYELMKQMKECIQNNPAETRQMLIMNPQLAYALLQAMVVMRIVDPQNALTMLYKASQVPPIMIINAATGNPQVATNTIIPTIHPNPVPAPVFSTSSGDVDLRSVVDPRTMDPRDPRMLSGGQQPVQSTDPRMGNRSMDLDMRAMPNPVPAPMQNPDPRRPNINAPTQGMNNIQPQQQQQQQQQLPFSNDPRQRADPRNDPRSDPRADPRLRGAAPPLQLQAQSNRLPSNGIPSDASDQEKAALIMQVLQLSDEQIAMLPVEQRTSILVLKEQIAKSTQQR